ncbi:MAG: addiction module protein [Chryseosolibacter sp.]
MENLHVNINLSIQQLVDVVKQLSPDEKLILNEAIWSEGMEIPQEHQTLVTDRIKNARQNPDRMLDWDDASKRLKP